MRTKTLLLAVALSAAGIATSMAQTVYSVNAVGYVNRTLPAGFNMIANPLNGTNNLLSTILPVVPEFSELYKFDDANQTYFSATTYIGGAWDVDLTLAPGEGAFINMSSAGTLTFVGEVPQGSPLNNPLVSNFQIRASQVPQSGALTTTLGYPADEFDTVFQYDSAIQEFKSAFTFIGGAWDPVDPDLAVGESVFIQRSAGGNWARTFNVNAP